MVAPARTFVMPDSEPVYAQGDAGMIKQAARILTDNAMRYSPEDERITLRAFRNEKGESCLSVQDNGAGMSAQDVPHIFERFYRSDRRALPRRRHRAGAVHRQMDCRCAQRLF